MTIEGAILLFVLALLLVAYAMASHVEMLKRRRADRPHTRELLRQIRRADYRTLSKMARERDAEWIDAGGTWN